MNFRLETHGPAGATRGDGRVAVHGARNQARSAEGTAGSGAPGRPDHLARRFTGLGKIPSVGRLPADVIVRLRTAARGGRGQRVSRASGVAGYGFSGRR
jgi:hypothetical protein